VLFHRLFLPTHITAFLLYLHPFAFAGPVEKFKAFNLFGVFYDGLFTRIQHFFDAAAGVYRKHFSAHSKNRIIPYVTSMIFFF
jgi:hypothetical protein